MTSVPEKQIVRMEEFGSETRRSGYRRWTVWSRSDTSFKNAHGVGFALRRRLGKKVGRSKRNLPVRCGWDLGAGSVSRAPDSNGMWSNIGGYMRMYERRPSWSNEPNAISWG